MDGCAFCNGAGWVRDRDGEKQDCDACGGSGFEYAPLVTDSDEGADGE